MNVMLRAAVVTAAGAAAALGLAAHLKAGAGIEPQAVVVNATPPAVLGAPPLIGTGVISGVVVDSETGAPIAGAVVYLSVSGRSRVGQQNRQVTDSRGRFVFVEVPASDRLSLGASRPGYLPGGYNSDERTGTSGGQLTLAEGQWLADARIELSKLGSISGTVLDERGEPVVGVYVRALLSAPIAGRRRLAAGPVTTTDDRGMYRIANLMPGRYLVVVPSVQASVPASSSSAEIAGWTEERVAAARARGQSQQFDPEQGVQMGEAVRVIVGPYPIPPQPAGGVRYAYPMTFHPGVTTFDGTSAVELGVGESRSAVDIRLSPIEAVQVCGRVDGPPEAFAALNLRLLASGLEELGLGSETATALVAADGSFCFANVPSGGYTIEAPVSVNEYRYSQITPFSAAIGRMPGVLGSGSWSDSTVAGPPGTAFLSTTLGGARSMSGRTSVAVGNRNVNGIVLRLRPAARISGRLEFEYDPNQPRPASPPLAQIAAEPADGSPALGLPRSNLNRNDPSQRFTIEGLLPGQYVLRSSFGLAWRVKSITYDGGDYTATPFDTTTTASFDDVVITLTNAGASISGSVRDGRAAPAVGARVIVFPADRTAWALFGVNPPGVRSVVTTNLGGYRIANLPAGSYYVVAVPRAGRLDWRDPEFFEQAVRWATRVLVDWGGTTTQDLVTSEVR